MASPVSVCLCVCLMLLEGTGFRLLTGHLGMDGRLWIEAISPKGQWLIYTSASGVKARSPLKGLDLQSINKKNSDHGRCYPPR